MTYCVGSIPSQPKKKKVLSNQPLLAEMLFVFSRKDSSTQNSSKMFKADT